jgi:hypothetical protein
LGAPVETGEEKGTPIAFYDGARPPASPGTGHRVKAADGIGTEMVETVERIANFKPLSLKNILENEGFLEINRAGRAMRSWQHLPMQLSIVERARTDSAR